LPLKDPGKSNALRVLFVNRMACLERGGGETFDLEISRHLARAGAQVTCLCGAPLLRPAPLPVAGVKTPVVMRLTAPNYYDPRGGVPQADALIASGTSIQKLRERGHAAVVDIPNAVDADLFRPQASGFRARNGIGRDEFVALYVARFQAFKNHAMLLEAFALFTREHPAARLVLAGSGPLRERCEQQAEALGIAGQVLFLGEVPFDNLPAVYAAADVKVISSDYESFCFAAIEAMSAGVPVLTTDCAWVPRLVADGAGMVVPVGDAEAFAAGLKKLADNPALRQRMGATGRQQVLERHTWPASAERLMRLYRRLSTLGNN
jgi:glycosyltransferase involved in cell wall biosynthesis